MTSAGHRRIDVNQGVPPVMIRLPRTCRVVIATVLIALPAATPALADHVISPNGIDSIYPNENGAPTCNDQGTGVPPTGVERFCLTDNSALWYYVAKAPSSVALGQVGIDTVHSIMSQFHAQTDLAVTSEITPVYSGSAETDIIYEVRGSAVPQPANGVTWCDDAVSSTRCDQHYIGFRNTVPLDELVCHESGHGVGLFHPAGMIPAQNNQNDFFGCMTVDPVKNDFLGSHNVATINFVY